MKLSTVLKTIGDETIRLDSMAGKILDICREEKITTREQFREAVAAAYRENGWRILPGRPTADDGLKTAPKTVKQYLWEVSLAYKLRMRPGDFTTYHAMRVAIQVKRQRLAQQEIEVEPQTGAMAGLRLVQANRFTGAHLHDLAVLYESVPRRVKSELEDAMKRLINKYMPKAPEQLRLVA